MLEWKKICRICQCILPLSEFYKQPTNKDGLNTLCKFCYRERVKRNYRKNKAHYHIYDKRRNQLAMRKKYHIEKNKESCLKYPEKYQCRYELNNAVRSGKIIRQQCEICGRKKTHGHHEDYTKPLDVIWLCQKHHTWIHS